jgi:hypothetical protein
VIRENAFPTSKNIRAGCGKATSRPGARRCVTSSEAVRRSTTRKPCPNSPSRNLNLSATLMPKSRHCASSERERTASFQPKTSDPLLPVTWNIANFGAQDCRGHDHRLIAEILGWFDVIATQETRSNLGGPGRGCRAPSALSPDAFVTGSNRHRFNGRH